MAAAGAVPKDMTAAIEGLGRLLARGGNQFTDAEVDLLEAASILLRSRFGQTTLPNPRGVVRSLVKAALDAMDAEDRRTADAQQSPAEPSSSPTRPRTPITG